jgi:hypothetical protein
MYIQYTTKTCCIFFDNNKKPCSNSKYRFSHQILYELWSMPTNSLDSLEDVHLSVLDDLFDARVCRAVHAAPVHRGRHRHLQIGRMLEAIHSYLGSQDVTFCPGTPSPPPPPPPRV